jgi:hypothetical protein
LSHASSLLYWDSTAAFGGAPLSTLTYFEPAT